MAKIEKTPAVTIHTLAYNVENYIRECAESILNQTFTDFEWVILDNACTDKTTEILKEYSLRDSRIKLFRNPRNSFLYNEPFNRQYVEYCENVNSEYWCLLDSDDYLHPDFLMELYTAAKPLDADIAVGGTEMFKECNPQLRGKRCPPDFYAEDITLLGAMFPQIYGCFRPMWGKLFKNSIVRKQQELSRQNPRNIKNGWDTLFCLDCLSFSNSVIGVNKVLHYYRIRENSLYNSQVDKARYLDYKIIYEESKKLLGTWDKLNNNNMSFIAEVLYSSLKDCMNVAAKTETESIDDKFDVIEIILSDESVYNVIKENGFADRMLADIQSIVNNFIDSLKMDELSKATTHYIYRLYKSFMMLNSPHANIHNAFLLYLSALCDKANVSKFASKLLYKYISLIGKVNIAEFEKHGIKSEFLATDTSLLRELVNSNFISAISICNENKESIQYKLLGDELKKLSPIVDFQQMNNAIEMVEKSINNGNIDTAVDLLLDILKICPINKNALMYKLYLLVTSGDIQTALETAETLRVFYFDDSEALSFASQAYLLAGLKDKAADILNRALDLCTDDIQRMEIVRSLESIQ